MLPHEVWEGHTAKARTVRTLATPLSWLYAFGWEAYLAVYALGIKKAASPHRPVICIGNLVVGGSGKSPLTIHVAKVVLALGRNVVIGCSGYGAPHAEDAAIAPEGQLAASEWGDEPSMIRWLLPDVPVVVGRNRVMAAKLVHGAYPDAVLVMDDGFQHLPLKKQLTVVIDDPNPKNSRCLPAGPYREPRFNRRRADLVIPNEFKLKRHPMRVITPEGVDILPERYSVLCALGNPTRFLKELETQFPNRGTTAAVLLGDHDPLTSTGLWESLPPALPVVVTAKDWVKLRDREDRADRQFLIALQDVEVDPGAEFKTWVERSFDE